MPAREIILKITNDKVWFNQSQYIDIQYTDIPKQHLSFKTYRDIYWKVLQKSFEKETGKLSVEITQYTCDDLSSFHSQNPKTEIKSLFFNTFHWESLEPFLSGYQRSKFEHLLIHKPIEYAESDEDWRFLGKKAGKNELETIAETLKEEFTVAYNDCLFFLGGVRFSKKIKCLKQTFQFEIKNDHILPEFDHIKYWFAKKMNSKKFRVKAYFLMKYNVLNEYYAKSDDIDYIDQDFIDGVKLQRTLGLPKYTRPYDLNKALFTSDDLYSLDEQNDNGGNIFNQNEQDIFNTLLENANVRNKKELTYLSGQVHSSESRIRFTNHPNFGFIFFTGGEKNNHFIWELLNSHATYIWSIEKIKYDKEWQYKRIEDSINTILNQGRETYKRAFIQQQADDDLIFNVIKHTEKESNLKDGFPKWKHRLQSLLT